MIARPFILLLLLAAPSIAGALKLKPTSVALVLVASPFDDFLVQTGNVEISFADGHRELLTKEGDCISPRLSSTGDVGWIRIDKSTVDVSSKTRRGRDSLVVQLLGEGRKEFFGKDDAPYLNQWAFINGGKSVALQSSGHHGPRYYRKI